jgi:hypothetical protein
MFSKKSILISRFLNYKGFPLVNKSPKSYFEKSCPSSPMGKRA